MTFKDTEIGRMPSDWEVEFIDNIKSDIKNAISMGPFGSKLKKETFTKDGVPIIRGNNLKRLYFDENEFVFVSKEKSKELKASFVKRRDIVITHRGTLGQVGYVPDDSKYDLYIVSQSGMKLTCDENKVNAKFLYYYLNSPRGQHYLLMNTSQVGVPAIAQASTSLKKIKIPIPKINEQQKIVNVLSSIDEKIEINNSVNKNLESIAGLLFKQWFINFEFPNESGDPYKSSGGEMVDSELGIIPKGWDVTELGDIVEVYSGYSYKGSDLTASEDAMVTIKNFNRNGGYKVEGLKEISISNKVKEHHYVNIFDVIVAHTDLTQQAEIIGNPIIIVSKGKYDRLIMSMDTVKVCPRDESINNFIIYSILKDESFKQYALGYVNGTTVLHLPKNTINKYKIAVPRNKGLYKIMGSYISTIMTEKLNINLQNERLIEMRSILLPKLMSGEIRVPLES